MYQHHHKGFTLVELMVVIVIIGVLAAVAVPKFSNAINKAHCVVVPHTLSKISMAQEAYYTESGEYKDNCGWGPGTIEARITAGEKLGIRVRDNGYFRYSSDRTTTGFNANAYVVKQLGKVEVGQKLQLKESGLKTLVPKTTKSGKAFASLLSGYLSN